MRTLTPREKRTIRLAAIGLAIYLLAFYGPDGWRFVEQKRTLYAERYHEARSLQLEFIKYQNKELQIQQLRKKLQISPRSLRGETLVGKTNAAIQEAAKACGFQLGPLRESAMRPSARELASLDIEGRGTTQAAIQLIHELRTLGFPLHVDSLSFRTTGMKPGQVQLNLSVAVLNFDAWKSGEEKDA